MRLVPYPYKDAIHKYESEPYESPVTNYSATLEEFSKEVGQDFIECVNKGTEDGTEYLVGLAHGQSPSGPYQYIFDSYNEIKRPDLIRYTFTNSRLRRQRDLDGIMDSKEFIRALKRKQLVSNDQIFGKSFNRESIEEYIKYYNEQLSKYLRVKNKYGYDYVFLASDTTGRVAGITRNSVSFDSQDIMVVVEDRNESEITSTPYFIMQSKRIAFLATKADKRRPLAWLYSRWGKPNESPSFLRHIEGVKQKMTVFIDDDALTWPRITLSRSTDHGESKIKVDLAKPYNEKAKIKLPVILLVHGFFRTEFI